MDDCLKEQEEIKKELKEVNMNLAYAKQMGNADKIMELQEQIKSLKKRSVKIATIITMLESAEASEIRKQNNRRTR